MSFSIRTESKFCLFSEQQEDLFSKVSELSRIPITSSNRISLQARWSTCLNALPVELLPEVELPDEFIPLLSTIWERRASERTSLLLDNKLFSPSSVKAFSEMLKSNNHLTSLLLCDGTLTIELMPLIANALKENRTIKELYLHDNDIDDESCQMLSEALKKNQSIEKLILQRNRISNNGARAIANLLEHTHIGVENKLEEGKIGIKVEASHLESINLSENFIRDEGAIAISKAVHKNLFLKEVDMRQNCLTIFSTMAFKQAKEVNPDITFKNDIKKRPRSKKEEEQDDFALFASKNTLRI